MIPMSYKELVAELPTLLDAKVVPYLRGSPSSAKSALAKEIAEKFNLKLIDIRLSERDPCEIGGYLYLDKDKERTYQFPLELFPLDTDEIPVGYKGWLIFLDEFGGCTPATQAVAYRLVFDRQVGQRDLHNKAYILAAGNKEDDGAIVNPMSTALISRFAIFDIDVNHREWMEWAVANGIDYRMTSFLNFKPNYLYQFKADATDPYACPRTWEMLSKVTKKKPMKEIHLAVLASLIGEGVAREFMTFLELESKLPKFEAIVANPEGTVMPTELGVQWAIMGMVAHNIATTNAGQVCKYLDRFTDELKVVTTREIRMRHPKLLDESKDFKAWIVKTAMSTFS